MNPDKEKRMKNLKKILMALVLVALLVSSAVTVAIAETSYSGSVAEANSLLQEAEEATEDKDYSLADVKAGKLKTLYEYLLTVNPADNGYAALVTRYDQMTLTVSHLYYEEAKAAASADYVDAMIKLCVYMKSAPVIKGDDAAIYLAYKCEICGSGVDFSDSEKFDGVNDDLPCVNACEDKQIVGDKELSYTAFKKDVNDDTLDVLGDMIDAIYSGAGAGGSVVGFYDVSDAKQAVIDFVANIDEMTYVEVSADVYTGSISELSAILDEIDKTAEYEELKEALSAAYIYMLETPVSPLTDEYAGFIKKYNELCDALVAKLGEKIDATSVVSEKAAVFNDFYKFIAGDEENPAIYLSENVVNACNDLRAELLDSFSEVDGKFDNLQKVEFTESEVVYRDDFDKFCEKLDQLEALGVDNAYASYFINELYAMAKTGLYDPAADPEAYSAAVAKYSELCREYVEYLFVDKADALIQIADKYTVLVDFRNFVSEMPLCEAVIDSYNELRQALLDDSKTLLAKISGEVLPDYVAPDKPTPTATSGVINSLYSNLLDSYNRYLAAVEDKAAILDEVKSSAFDLYSYIVSSVIDTEADYYEQFVENYSELRENVANAIFAVVEEASAENKIAALDELGKYLKTNPITKATVVRYNALVDTLVADAAEAAKMKLSNVFIDIENVYADIADPDATLEEKMSGAVRYDAYLDVLLDVTDPAYATFLENYSKMDKIVGDAIYTDIVESIKSLDATALKARLTDYLDFIKQVYTQNLVLSYRKAVKSTSDTLVAIIDRIETNYANVAYYETEQVAILGYIEEFLLAETFEEKREIFKAIYAAMGIDKLNTVFVSGTSYPTVSAAYAEVLAELEVMALSSIDTSLSPLALCQNLESLYAFLSECPFSKNVVDTYNSTLEAVRSESYYDALAESIADELVYAPEYKEGWTGDVSAIVEKLDAALAAETVSDDFYDAYEILGGFGEAPVLVDFATVDFAEMLAKFNAAKLQLVNEKKTIVDDANGFTNKVAELEIFREFAEEYAFSATLAEYYNAKIEQLKGECDNAAADSFDGYLETVERLHEIVDSYPIDATLLDDTQTRKYNIYTKLISIADFGEINGRVDSYYEVDESDSKALIVQNSIVDQINRYVKTMGISSYNDNLLVITNAELMFINFLDLLDAETEEADKEAKITELGEFIIENKYPQALVDIYNARYIADRANHLTAAKVNAASEKGSLLAYSKLLATVSKADTTDDMLDALTEAVAYINAHKFDTTDLSTSVQDKIAELNASIERKTEEQKKVADSNAEISDYAKPIYKTFDHEDGKLYQSSVYGNEYKNTATMKVAIEENGNRYAQMTYTYSSVPYTDWGGLTGDQGLVFDFDVMSHDSLSLRLRFTSSGIIFFSVANGQLSYTMDGASYPDVQFSGYRQGIDDPIVFTPGEWTHVTIILNPDSNTMEMLIDYVSIGTKPIISTATSSTPYSIVRFQTNGATYNTICYDNLIIYAGTSYRIFDKLEKMNNDEKFAYCVSMFTNPEISATSRYNAYVEAGKLLGYVTEQSAAAKLAYEQFDSSEIKSVAHGMHMKNLEALVKDVDVSDITTKNTSEMAIKVAAVSDYIEKNRLYFDQSAPRFIEIVDIVRQAEERATWLKQLQAFVAAVEKFNRAPSLAALERYYQQIVENYVACELHKSDKYAAAASDPLVVALVETMAADPTITAIISEVTLDTIYSEYLAKKMTTQSNLENSGKIVDAIDIIGSLVTNRDELDDSEYLEELLRVANENVDFVDQYLAVIREILNKKAYDEDVEGVEEAILIFEALDEMFFANLQAKHFGVISEQLTRYSETNSYIEKAGICTFVRNYINDNNVDMSGTDGVRYLHTLETYEAELENYKKDYEAILEANTQAFIGIVNEMSANVSYSKLKPLYTTAIEKYYYNMNSDSAEVQAALVVFEELESKILTMEADGALFVGYAANLRYSTRQAQIYQALVNCSKYIDKLDSGVAGVRDAIELYNEKLVEYTDNINPINSEISSTLDVTLAFRVNSISETVLAVIKNIFYINK